MGIVTRANSFMTKEKAMGFWHALMESVTWGTGTMISFTVMDP